MVSRRQHKTGRRVKKFLESLGRSSTEEKNISWLLKNYWPAKFISIIIIC